MCRRSRAKMDQALPPLFVPAGQRSYVDIARKEGEAWGRGYVSPAMAASNGHKSETTSSITTKRGIGMGSVAFADVILLKSLSKKCVKPRTEMVRFSCGDTVDLTRVPAGTNFIIII